ncbi:MAG: bifunctional phosphoribosyl-AMP cyclohydrolase/phosphoribosyl-ATP diphosphatase HisIE [Synergistetes bacterium]|nr:bifunctional phosphoribosyl-AMP cyclohydrolase/phosphoribosyl-ATP diphosphatase HisIE [Synergistota bacterium]MCX8128034.1 bifunctional phosphoribosyl-AMP cyclohydrolase/phosphoribosyl-ATP diphosphatase HisIE [Synergistota bacterium]MDW8193072.1 bifunctional phosphoribosyl-AMP cyclohydrolase/phosphoribosyl-ATP diphosphatase HisIE [Synergistota bacterium]
MNLKFDENGLIPVITQDYKTKEVLMLAYMNKDAFEKTLETGYVHYWSRSRKSIWKKGESSGNLQKVISIKYDCDEDALLIEVEQKGVACHTGNYSCFYRSICQPEKLFSSTILDELYKIIENRIKDLPEGSYTASLVKEGEDAIIRKIGEESVEVILAFKNKNKKELIAESADLLYHLLVALAFKEVKLDEVWEELEKRRKRTQEKDPEGKLGKVAE